MTAASKGMSDLFRAGRTVPSVRVVPEQSEGHRALNQIIRRNSPSAADEGPAEPAGELKQVADQLGCVDLDALRRLAPELEGLAGAALRSATIKALRDRPALVGDGLEAAVEATGPAQLDGGGGRGTAEQESPSSAMSGLLRRASGRYAGPPARSANGIPRRED